MFKVLDKADTRPMTKTKRQLYEEIYDSLHQRVLGLEIDIAVNNRKNSETILGAERINGPMGPSVRNITIKDQIEKQKTSLGQLRSVLAEAKLKLNEANKGQII